MNMEYKIPEENILEIMHGFVRGKNYKQQKGPTFATISQNKDLNNWIFLPFNLILRWYKTQAFK